MGKDHRSVRATLPVASQAKIVLLSRNAYHWQYGGAERFTFNLASALVDHKIQPIVVSRVPELLSHCREHGITTRKQIWLQNETRRRRAIWYYPLLPLLIGQFILTIIRYRVDVLVLGSRDDQIFGTIAATITRRPVIWVDHADMKGVTGQPLRILRRLYYWAMRQARRIVVVSRAEKALIMPNLPPNIDQSKFVVINNGAIKRPSHPLSAKPDEFIITYVGRIEADKGIYELISAAKKLCATHPHVTFWLGGKGSAEASVRQQIADAKLTDRIILLGHLENVYDALDACKLFVYPSHHDASPLAPAEALLSGLPVVATRIGGIPETVNATCGILIQPGDPHQLYEALDRLITDPLLYSRLQQGARKRAAAVDFNTIVETRYLPIIQEVYHG